MLKKVFSLLMSVFLLLSLCCVSICAEDICAKDTNNYLQSNNMPDYYQNYVNYSITHNPNIELMTYDQFIELYEAQNYESVNNYIAYLKATIDEYSTSAITPCSSSGSSSGNGDNWYDIGKELPEMPSHGKYDFSDVKAGDILYEGTGFGGLTGHIAIVEGWFYDDTYDVYYIRLIESVSMGVVRSYLDDDRFEKKEGQLFHVDATDVQINDALYFCTKQLGKPWALQPFTKPTSIDHPRWQCSTMVWAAYNYAGVDVEQHGLGGGPGITPHDVRDADTTTEYLNYTQKED